MVKVLIVTDDLVTRDAIRDLFQRACGVSVATLFAPRGDLLRDLDRVAREILRKTEIATTNKLVILVDREVKVGNRVSDGKLRECAKQLEARLSLPTNYVAKEPTLESWVLAALDQHPRYQGKAKVPRNTDRSDAQRLLDRELRRLRGMKSGYRKRPDGDDILRSGSPQTMRGRSRSFGRAVDAVCE